MSSEELGDHYDSRVDQDLRTYDDIRRHLKNRYGEDGSGVLSDSAVDVTARELASRREEGEGATGPIDFGDEGIGDIEYDPDAGTWRDPDTGQFRSRDE